MRKKRIYKKGPRISCICRWCRKVFLVQPSVVKEGYGKFCCRKCKYKAQSKRQKGENSSFWKGGKIRKVCKRCKRVFYVFNCNKEANYCCRKCRFPKKIKRKCKQCNKLFYVIPSKVEAGWGNYCCLSCYKRSRIKYKRCGWCGKRFRISPPIHHFTKYCCKECANRGRSKKVKLKCPVCGKVFYRQRHLVKKYEIICCCKKCANIIEKGRFKGKENGNWRGGLSREPYAYEFDNDLKGVVRKRDKYRCWFPGCNKKENGRKHSVHHIDYDKRNSDPINLILVCLKHNGVVNGNRKYWEKYFKKAQKNRKLKRRIDEKC